MAEDDDSSKGLMTAEQQEIDELRRRFDISVKQRDALDAAFKTLQRDQEDNDGTDFAHPAWWRGHDKGVWGATDRIRQVLDGKDAGHGVIGDELLEKTRRDVISLMKERDEALADTQKARRDFLRMSEEVTRHYKAARELRCQLTAVEKERDDALHLAYAVIPNLQDEIAKLRNLLSRCVEGMGPFPFRPYSRPHVEVFAALRSEALEVLSAVGTTADTDLRRSSTEGRAAWVNPGEPGTPHRLRSETALSEKNTCISGADTRPPNSGYQAPPPATPSALSWLAARPQNAEERRSPCEDCGQDAELMVGGTTLCDRCRDIRRARAFGKGEPALAVPKPGDTSIQRIDGCDVYTVVSRVTPQEQTPAVPPPGEEQACSICYHMFPAYLLSEATCGQCRADAAVQRAEKAEQERDIAQQAATEARHGELAIMQECERQTQRAETAEAALASIVSASGQSDRSDAGAETVIAGIRHMRLKIDELIVGKQEAEAALREREQNLAEQQSRTAHFAAQMRERDTLLRECQEVLARASRTLGALATIPSLPEQTRRLLTTMVEDGFGPLLAKLPPKESAVPTAEGKEVGR